MAGATYRGGSTRSRSRPAAPDLGERLTLIILVVLLLVIALGGGASRGDAFSQPMVRLASLAAVAWVLWRSRLADLRSGGWPLGLLALLAALASLQLLPLPPVLWNVSDGHHAYAEFLRVVGQDAAWRPMSISPDRTLNSLLALLCPAAILLLLSQLPGRSGRRDRLVMEVWLVILLASALLSVVQVGGGVGYLYRVTNEGSAVGLFANRNHQALFLACGLPLLAAWVIGSSADPRQSRIRTWVALCGAAAIWPALLITGSRAGLVLGALGTIFALILILTDRNGEQGRRDRVQWRRTGLLVGVPLIVALFGVAMILAQSRGEAVERLFRSSEAELRANVLPTLLRMLRDYQPFGAGFGAFDPAFRRYEAHASLTTNYLNQAHNDWLQIGIEGGIPALLLLLAFVLLCVRAAVRAWSGQRRPATLHARAALFVIILIAAASLVDYPLRTPLVAALMACSLYWLARGTRPVPDDRRDNRVGSNDAIG